MTQRKWLLAAHILFSFVHLAPMICVLTLAFLSGAMGDAALFKAAYALMVKLDHTLIPVSGLGMVLTGILLGALTHWGLNKSYWIIAKEAVTLLAIVNAVLIIKPALEEAAATASEGLGALANPGFLAVRNLHMRALSLELVLLFGVITISVLKPWGQRRKAA